MKIEHLNDRQQELYTDIARQIEELRFRSPKKTLDEMEYTSYLVMKLGLARVAGLTPEQIKTAIELGEIRGMERKRQYWQNKMPKRQRVNLLSLLIRK